MADIALGYVEKILKAGLAIKKAVETVRQNEEECRDIEEVVSTVIAILSTQLRGSEAMNQPGMTDALVSLDKAMDRALRLVTACQERHILRRFFTAGDIARQLHRVKNDLQNKMMLWTVAVATATATIVVEYNIQYGSLARCPPLRQAQDAGEVDISYNNHSNTDDASGIITETTGSDVPPAPSTRSSTEFSLSKSDTTVHNFCEKIPGGGGKQKIVIKVQMTSKRSRDKAMNLAARIAGVHSVAIAGESMDQVVLVGEGVDSVRLTMVLRKKLGFAELLQREEIKIKAPTASAAGSSSSTNTTSPPGTCHGHEAPPP